MRILQNKMYKDKKNKQIFKFLKQTHLYLSTQYAASETFQCFWCSMSQASHVM